MKKIGTTTMKTMEIQVWPIEKLKPYKNNVKIHDDKQVEKIAESIRRFGWDQPIVVDGDGVIIKGHGRTLAAKKLGLAFVPVVVRSDLTPEEANASRISDNRVAMGDLDTEGLRKELESLNFDLKGIFDLKELEFLERDLTEINPANIEHEVIEEMEKQTDVMRDNIRDIDNKPVKIAVALGFDKVKGMDQRSITRFMARIEDEYGKQGADAFVAFVKDYIENK